MKGIKMKKTLMIMFLAGLTFAFSQPHFGHGRCQPEGCPDLELSDQQRAQMDDLDYAFELERIDLRAGLKKAELELEAMLGVESPNRKAVDAQIRKISEAKAELRILKTNHGLDVKDVLTDEQQELLQEHRKMHRERGPHRMKNGGPCMNFADDYFGPDCCHGMGGHFRHGCMPCQNEKMDDNPCQDDANRPCGGDRLHRRWK